MLEIRKSLQIWLTGIMVSVFMFSMYPTVLEASQLGFQKRASDVILNSLKVHPKHSFLRKFYTQLFFMPAWVREGSTSSATKEFFAHIKNDITLYRNSKLYQDTVLLEGMAKEIYSNRGTLVQKINLEFKISQLYKGYTDYAYFGSINWGAFQARISNLMVNDVSTEWVLHRPDINPVGMVENTLLGGSLGEQLQDAIPSIYRYKALQKELQRYMTLKANGGWQKVVIYGKFKLGAEEKGIPSLRERLSITGDYVSCGESQEGLVYDVCLQKAVKKFQARNGLAVDGVVGSGTLRTHNRSIDDRIITIRLNLDRIKWLNEQHSKRHIVINIPDFRFYFEEDGKLRQTMRVVVGTPNHPTPIFSDIVEYIVLNPYWNVPTSIIQKEFVPKLIKNSNAMKKQDIEIRDGWGKNAELIDPSTIDWHNYGEGTHMPFRFAQVPGNKNALGKVKFLFPNKFAVYMHDTPSKSLFGKNKRAFSHGCIRLQKPRELLKTFSTFNSNIDFGKSQEILKGKKKTRMNLKERVPVDVIYLTAWVDYDGVLQFRNDIYNYDKMQLKSFRKW